MLVRKPIRWTSELLADFWDGISDTRLSALSFSALAGKSCIQAFLPFLDPSKSYLDFGGGDGHLAALLCAQGFRIATYDPSGGRSHAAERRLSSYGANYLGSVRADTDQRFDGIFLIEVAEHILDEAVAPTYELIHKLLAPGGLLFLTTPNREDLELGFAFEPQSGAFFHRWQHLRSFDRDSLLAMLKPFGLYEVLVHEIEFRQEAFDAMNASLAQAGLKNPFATMRPVMMGARSNLAAVFCTEDGRIKVDRTPYFISLKTVAQLPADAAYECRGDEPAIPLSMASFRHDSGFCYSCPLTIAEPSDSNENPVASPVRLFENDAPLSIPHAMHDEIRRLGAGTYSHWGNQLYFSSSDGSDPGSNGRRYAIRIATNAKKSSKG